jgi:hypothetical protein
MFFKTLDVEGIIIIVICVIILLKILISGFKGMRNAQRLRAMSDYCLKNGIYYTENLTRIPVNSKILSVMGKKERIEGWGAEMYGNRNGFDFYIFDHTYISGTGRRKSIITETICLLTNNNLDLPQFYIRDEYFFYDDLGKLFGGQDINFEEDPVFSSKFILQGKAEPSIRRFFNRKVRDVFVNNHIKGYSYEGSRDCFAVMKIQAMDAEERVKLLSDAIKIFKQFEPPKIDFLMLSSNPSFV